MTAERRTAVIDRLRAAAVLDKAEQVLRDQNEAAFMTALRSEGLIDVPYTRPVRDRIHQLLKAHNLPTT